VPYPIQFGKGSNPMPSYTSRAQDCAEKIKQASIAVEKADAAYRKGGSLNDLNRANAKLADCHFRLYEIDGGVIPDRR
jgi:hypothetical protein